MGYLFPVLSPPADLIVYREEELGNLIYPFQTTDIFRPKLFSTEWNHSYWIQWEIIE